MAVKGDGVATSIDAHVRESIEKMVSEIRSTIDDVRVAVDQQLKAALQSMQADVNSVTFLPQIQKSIAELEETLGASGPAPAPAAGVDAGRIKLAIQAIEQGKSQVDVLNALLEQALQYGSRAALFILRGETFGGWKGVGFGPHGGNDDNIKRFNAAPGLISQFDDLYRNEHVVVWDGLNLSSRLGGAHSERAVLIPMVIKDKVAAAVYVDVVDGETAKLDTSALELLVFTTGLLIDTLAIRKKIPSPSLQEAAGATVSMMSQAPPPARPAAPAPPPQPAAPPAAARPVAPPVAAPAAPPVVARPAPAPAPAPAAPAFTPPPRPAAPAAPAAPPRIPTSSGSTRLPSMEVPRPAAEPAGEEKSSTQYIPPPGLARGGAFATTSDDAKRHDEARRFARLLVSEIKLYNEAKVDQGRKNKDLYERLKEDIDRSRQMYDERIGQDIRSVSNYFYDELVRILADGQADVLGL